jgi:NADH-quinone oxidoreductase subunit C
MISVAAHEWVAEMADAHGRGLTSLELLTGVDRRTHVEVIARVVDPDTGRGEEFSTVVNDGGVPSISSTYPGAAWYERECREMFGVVFEGALDTRPLMLQSIPVTPPLLKSSVLQVRASTPWPGAAEPGGSPGRRRLRPPGVPEDWPPA